MSLLGATSLLLMLAAGEDSPEYPLGRLRFPSLTTATSPITLTDLHYRFSQEGSTSQFFEARVRLGTFAFLGGEVNGNRRGVFFDTVRTELFLSEDGGHYEVEAAYRAPRWIFRANGRRRAPGEGKSWIVRADGSVRLNPDLEVLLGWLEDTAPEETLGFSSRTVRRGSLGLFYQVGNALEVSANASRRRITTEGGFPLERDRWTAAGAYFHGSTQLDGNFTYEWTRGRLLRRQGFTEIRATQRVAGHFVAFGSLASGWETGIKLFQEELRGGLTFFGRRYRFDRGSEAAARTLALTRRAYALGYNERRVYGADALRELRERLALSRRRAELAPEIDALYRAEVEERNVAQAGFEIGYEDDNIAGRSSRSYRVFAGVPWRPALPFRRSEAVVDFVGVAYTVRNDRYSPGLTAITHEVSLDVAFNREVSLLFNWEDPGLTPIDIALFRGRSRRITLEFSYAFGR